MLYKKNILIFLVVFLIIILFFTAFLFFQKKQNNYSFDVNEFTGKDSFKFTEKGKDSFYSGDFEDAEYYFKKALSYESDKENRAFNFLMLGATYTKKREYDVLLKFIDDFEENNPDFIAYTQLFRSKTYSLMGEKEKALEWLSKAEEQISLLEKEEQQLNDFFTINKIFYGLWFEKNYEELISFLNKSQFNADYKDYLRAQIYFEAEEYDKSLYFLNKTKKEVIIEEQDGFFTFMTAISLLQEEEECINTKNYFQELINLETKIILYPVSGYLGLGECELRNKNYEKALYYFLKGLDLTEKEEINHFYFKFKTKQTFIMLNHKIIEIFLIKNEPEKTIDYIKNINEIKDRIPLDVWEIINYNYWPKNKSELIIDPFMNY